MSSEKKRLKELKRPDTFQKKALALIDWCVTHKNQLLTAIVPILLITGGVFAWTYVQKKSGESRRKELAAIDQMFMKEAEAAIKQQEAIHKKMEEITSKLKAEDDKKPAPQSAEQKALEEQLKNIKPDHAESQAKFLAFYKEHPKTPEGWRAALNVASIYIEAEKYKEASELIEEFLPHAASLDFYATQVRTVYISLLEELGEYDKALQEAETLLSSQEEDELPKALLIKGRLQLLSGQKDQAHATFQKIVVEHNTSPEAHKAKAYKSL